MARSFDFDRRNVLQLAGGLIAAAGLGTSRVLAQTTPSAGAALPARGEFIVRGGHVLTMDSTLGDLATGDVHVRDGVVVAVGPNISAPAAQVIDGRDMIVMPGFVETHWHLWSTSLRLVVRAD